MMKSFTLYSLIITALSLSPTFAQDNTSGDSFLGDVGEKLRVSAFVGINQSFGAGQYASDLKEDLKAFREMDFSENSSFSYTAKGQVEGDARMRPLTGFSLGANVSYALLDMLEVELGLQFLAGGTRWYYVETYADDEFQYDEHIRTRHKQSFSAIELPLSARLVIGRSSLVAGVSFAQTFSARDVVRYEDIVWINTSKEKDLSTDEKDTFDYEDISQIWVSAHLGLQVPVGEKMALELKAQRTTPVVVGGGFSATIVSLNLSYLILGNPR